MSVCYASTPIRRIETPLILDKGNHLNAAQNMREVSNEGTWRLVMRKLPDGKKQVLPAILGAYTVHNGLQNLNVFRRTSEGRPVSFSRISTYKMSAIDFTETLLFSAMNDGSDNQQLITFRDQPRALR